MGDLSANYEMLEELGSGSFGVVYKALERSTGELVAVKHVDLDGTDDDILDIQQEIALLSTCSSPYVTKYKTSFVRGVKLWIIMEFLAGGSCLDLINVAPFNEAHAAVICRELLLGLDYLHTSGKIHRDIKAANILLSHTGRVKIADFGVAAQLTNIKSQRMTFVGTPFWMAPEVIKELGYDCKADIWSLGITAMELVNGEPPNADLHPMKALFHIPKSPSPRLEGSQFSREMKSFVAACLIKDPNHRPTAKDLLNHRFIRNAGRPDMLKSLIQTRQRQLAAKDESNHTRYYEETLRDMNPMSQDDNWVFDTIKPASSQAAVHTIKKRKLSQAVTTSLEPPTEMLKNLDLRDTSSPPPQAPSSPQTVRNIKPQTLTIGTARKVSSPLKKIRDSPAEASLSPRKVQSPSRKSSAQKQPLALDMSFGNGQSTTRPFRRISDESPAIGPGELPSNNENVPPKIEPTTKEAKLGRRFFSSVIDPAVQEVYAQTASNAKQEALSKVGRAWADLDALDPDGEYLLLKAIFERVQSDSKLAALLKPVTLDRGSQMPVPSQPCSTNNPSTPQKERLVLSQSNPHLEKHYKQRLSSQASLLSGNSEQAITGLPGQNRPGMDHTKQLADALYGRWVEGLRGRWAQP